MAKTTHPVYLIPPNRSVRPVASSNTLSGAAPTPPGGIDGPRSALRRSLRAGSHRSGDCSESLLPGAALHWNGIPDAADTGGHARGQGGGRLGRRVHRVLLDSRELRRFAAGHRLPMGRGGRARPGADGGEDPPTRRVGRCRTLVRRRCERKSLLTRGVVGPLEPPGRRGSGAVSGDGQGGHPGPAWLVRRSRRARPASRLRHRLLVRLPRVHAVAVPVAGQPAIGRVWGFPGEPRAPALRADRRDEAGGRRHLRRGRALLRRRAPRAS